jgi:hypothetical protein
MTMQATHRASIMFAGCVALFSLPANAGDKQSISGVNKDQQTVSETSSTVPDQPNHVFKQAVMTWKTESTNPDWTNVRATGVEHQDIIGPDIKVRGYGTNHHPNGDVDYFSWEGSGKVMSDKGDMEAQGRYIGTGGTGKFKSAKGSGTYSCKFTSSGGQCDWKGEIEY